MGGVDAAAREGGRPAAVQLIAVAIAALEHPVDFWMTEAYKAALLTLRQPIAALAKTPGFDLAAHPRTAEFLKGRLKLGEEVAESPKEPKLPPAELALYRKGREVYHRDVHCATCHQADGRGDAIYPPLAGSEWVTGDETRLIKLVLKGAWGPITVKGRTYDPKNGLPPMIGFENLLKDDEVAAVLTYVRQSFGNKAPPVKPASVAAVRRATSGKKDFYMIEDLLKEHPF